MNPRNVTWPIVAVIGLVLASVVILALQGRDTTALLALGAALFAGMGLNVAQTQAVKEQGNGNTSRLLQIVEAQGRLLAAAAPPAPADVERVDQADAAAAAGQTST